jgi:hypothetical protein
MKYKDIIGKGGVLLKILKGHEYMYVIFDGSQRNITSLILFLQKVESSHKIIEAEQIGKGNGSFEMTIKLQRIID